jgi:penicillin-binding protein 2
MIANKGSYYIPHVIDSIEGGDKYGLLAPYKKRVKAAEIPDHMFEAVHEGMDAVVQGPTGTARRMKIEGVVMCGKTGTVENYFKGKKQRDHSFFAAFAPRKNPQIAIACIVENAGFGGTVAAPIVSLMVEKYMNDTISKARLEWVERYSNMKIMPARIQAEIIKRDSLRKLAEMQKLQKALEKQQKERAATKVPGLQTMNRPSEENLPHRPSNSKAPPLWVWLPLQQGRLMEIYLQKTGQTS